MSESLTINNSINNVRSRPNSFEINSKDVNGKISQRNSSEIKNDVNKVKSRPNSMEMNGHDTRDNNYKRSTTNYDQVRRSVSMDPKEVTFLQTTQQKWEEQSQPQIVPEEPFCVKGDETRRQEAKIDVTAEVKINSSVEPTAKSSNGNLAEVKSQGDTSAENSTEPPESEGSTVTATASNNGTTTVVTVEPTATVSRPKQVLSHTTIVTATPLTTAGCMAQQQKTAKYEIIAVRERHGMFRKAVPVMPVSVAVVFCILNVITPGIGTLAAGFTVLCGCPTEYENRMKSMMYNVVAAILQLVTAPFVIGWVWSIMWGVTFVNVSVSKGIDETIVTSHV